MATTRFSHLDDFTQDGQRVGIGTSTPTEALEVIGGSRSKNIEVTGIATLTSYEGFQNKKTSYVDNIRIDSGESGTLSGEVVIGAGLSMSVGTGATTGQGSIKSLKVGNTFTPPCGRTNDRPSASKPGALFYNKDFKTIEYWDGNFWRQVDNTTTSGRGIWGGGTTPTYQSMQDFVTISSLGNAQNFGELTVARGFFRAVASSVRGVTGGGENPSGRTDTMEYFTIQSEGNAIDFGNLTAARGMMGSTSSSTRGLWGGGEESGGNVNKIEYIEISTVGNAIDYGDLSVTRKDPHSGLVNSPTRGIIAAGGANIDSVIDVITIAAKGNSVKFGDLSEARKGLAGCSNTTRGIFICGEAKAGPVTTTLDYITIASDGNAIDFGDAVSARYIINGGCSNETRGVWSGGSTALELIEYVNFATLGDALDFGNLSVARRAAAGCSDSHGGLGGY